MLRFTSIVLAGSLLSLAPICSGASAQSVACGAEKVLGSIETDSFDLISLLDPNTLIAIKAQGLSVFDITDAANITSQVTFSLGENSRGFALHDGFVYYSLNQPNELSVVSVEDPINPQFVSTIAAPSSYARMAFAGNYAYFSGNQVYNGTGNMLYIYDISSPTNPVLVNTIDMGTPIVDLQATPGHLYIRSSDIFAYDLNDPINPVLDSTLVSSEFFNSMRVVGNLVYHCENFDRLLITDYTDPANPITLGSLELAGSPSTIFVQGSLAFVKNNSSSFNTIDINDPMNPIKIGSTTELFFIKTITPDSDRLVLAEYGMIKILNTASTIAPAPTQSLNPTGGFAQKTAIVGNRCYLTARIAGLMVYDITEPHTPILVSTVPTTGIAWDIKTQGDYAFVTYFDGFDVFDLSDPDNPTFITTVSDTEASYLSIQGQLLAVSSVEPGFIALYDITNPANPTHISTYVGPEYPGELIINGNTIYCAGGYSSLVSVDISDPTNPVTAGIYDAPGYAEFTYNIALIDNIALVNSDGGHLYSVDVSDPFNLELLSSTSVPFEATAFAVSNNRLVTNGGGIHLYDISDPASITWIAAAQSPSQSFRPTISGDTVFAGSSASYAEGLWTINIGECNTCQADLDHDGSLNFFDISAFLNAFNNQNPIADFEPDGQFNFFDISAFLAAFGKGCP